MSTSSDSTNANSMSLYFQVGLFHCIGNVDVKHVNLRPDKANEFIARSPLPFAIKAGMLGKLSLKV